MKKLNYDLIEDIEFDNVNFSDAHDFSDAFISKALYDDPKTGLRELTDEEIDSLDSEWVYDRLIDYIY